MSPSITHQWEERRHCFLIVSRLDTPKGYVHPRGRSEQQSKEDLHNAFTAVQDARLAVQ